VHRIFTGAPQQEASDKPRPRATCDNPAMLVFHPGRPFDRSLTPFPATAPGEVNPQAECQRSFAEIKADPRQSPTLISYAPHGFGNCQSTFDR
jgi:hypothetical protein